MTKEIAIKVKVEGQEVTMAGRQLDNFKKTIENLKKQLESLGARTEQNGEQFDKLKGDLDALNAAFGETNTEVQDTNDSLKKNDEQVQENEKTTKSYTSQIRDLTKQLVALGDRTEENGAQYDSLQSRIKELRDKQEDLQFGTRKLDDALSSLPGPIGQVAGGFKNLDDTFKNAKSALKGLTTQFPILKNAIAATGIGALVILFGLLVAGVMKAFQTFKPLQEAVGKLGIVFDLVQKSIQPLIDLIGKGLTWALEGLAKGIAWITGNMDEYNKALADKKATQDFLKNSKDRIQQLKKESITAKDAQKESIDNEIEYLEAKSDLETKYQEDGKEKDQDYYNELELIELKYQQNSIVIQNEALKKKKEQYQNYWNEAVKLQNEKQLLLAKNEYEASKITLKQQYDSQVTQIKQLETSELNKQKLLLSLKENYNLKVKQLDEDNAKSVLQANMLLNLQLREVSAESIIDEQKRLTELAGIRNEAALLEIQNSKETQDIKNKRLLTQAIIYDNELTQIELDSEKRRRQKRFENFVFELETTANKRDAMRILHELAGFNEIERVKRLGKLQINEIKANFEAEREQIKIQYEEKLINEKQYRTRLGSLVLLENQTIKQSELDTYNAVTGAIAGYRSSVEGLNGVIGNLVTAMGEETKAGKALVKVQQVLSAVTMSLAAAEAFRGLMKDISKGFPTNIIAVASTLATIAAAVAGWVSVFKKSKPEGSPEGNSGGSSTTSTPYYGKNYADGGMIGGRRHAQGGTLIEAEQGEAIMTRGAVSMFRPMLSLMNQMGGGKSFDARIVKPDNPITKQVNQEPIIMKTYVVESELTSEQNKQARLKNLSTI